MSALKDFAWYWVLAAAYLPLRLLFVVLTVYEKKHGKPFPAPPISLFDVSGIFIVAEAPPDRHSTRIS